MVIGLTTDGKYVFLKAHLPEPYCSGSKGVPYPDSMSSWTKKTLVRFWRATWKYKVPVSFSVLGVVGASVINAIIPLYFKNFFNILSGGGNPDVVANGLIGVLIIIAILELSQWLAWRIGTFTSSYFQSRVMYDLTNDAFAYLHHHSFGFFENNFVGSLTKKIKWFGRAYETISDRILWNLLPLVTNIVVILYVLYARSWWLGTGIVAWLVIFFVVNSLLIKFKLKYDLQRATVETETTGLLADTITNYSTIKLFTGFLREFASFQSVADRLRRLRRLTWDLGNYFDAIQGLLMTILEVGIFYLAIRLWQRSLLTLGDFVLIQAYLINIFMRIWDFGKTFRSIYESLSDAAEMTEIYETPQEITDVPSARPLQVTAGRIQFVNVDFYYHRTRQILHKLNLDIAPGEHLALVGPSGAGKSTILKIIMRMHDIAAGQVLIDGQSITRVTQDSLRQAISVVPQDPILFHRTLMENIRYGKPSATDAEVIDASRAAHCDNFISQLSAGYQTYVGERGIKLSSGERQRVAIARAILRDAPILILDEATSSLDSESERLIQESLDRLMADRTVIAVAHRLSTIKKMDRIVVIDGGNVIEAGSHGALLRRSGTYHQLWKLQAGGFIQ